MARLAPPIIEGTIPAFCNDAEGKAIIKVPFAMNRGVSIANVDSFSLKIKTIASSTYLGTFTTPKEDYEDGILEFDLSGLSLNEGQFYKIQVAYNDNTGDVGYYSAVSTVKYTTRPEIKILDLELGQANQHLHQYTGVYSQDITADTTEKVYTYCFTIYDSAGQIYYTTGELLHNSDNDTEFNISSDIFEYNYDLMGSYAIQYSVKTINNLEIATEKYTVSSQNFKILNGIELIPIQDSDNGYISIFLKVSEALEAQDFVLQRHNRDKDIKENIANISIEKITSIAEIFKDFTYEQGYHYQYSLISYSDSSNSKVSSEIIYGTFEDLFLYDGNKQLKISLNPQVGTFKNDILEQKVDTIGSKYPFAFRNGRVNYHELAIAGLISYHMDNDQLFLTNKEMGLIEADIIRTQTIKKSNSTIAFDNERSTELSSYNFHAERIFKTTVLDWITDGKIKLFRSPAEGNYLIRLFGASMTPNQQLGRMIHNFTCQAYEMAPCDVENLNKYNILNSEIVINNNQVIDDTSSVLKPNQGNEAEALRPYGGRVIIQWIPLN